MKKMMKWYKAITDMPLDDNGIPTEEGLAELLGMIADAMGFEEGHAKRGTFLDRLGMVAATKVER